MQQIRAVAHLAKSIRLAFDAGITRLLFKLWGVSIGTSLKSSGWPVIYRYRNSSISIGSRCEMSNDTAGNILGLAHPCMLSTMAENASISIGDDVGMSGVTISARQQVIIGNEVLIGANAMIVDNDLHSILPQSRRHNNTDILSSPVKIGDQVFIGANVIILKGVSIGEGSIIGAGSVVTRDVPARVIAAGNPVVVIREIRD